MEQEIIPIGTRVQFDWDDYDISYNTEYSYNGTYTITGIVVDFDENNYEDKRMRKDGNLIKIKADGKYFSWNDGYCYVEKDKVKIINNAETFLENFKKFS